MKYRVIERTECGRVWYVVQRRVMWIWWMYLHDALTSAPLRFATLSEAMDWATGDKEKRERPPVARPQITSRIVATL